MTFEHIDIKSHIPNYFYGTLQYFVIYSVGYQINLLWYETARYLSNKCAYCLCVWSQWTIDTITAAG